MDSISRTARSENMRRIRAKNTKPEISLRSALHRLGLRYRLHKRDLPGTPDIVFPSLKAIIEIRGCFWHKHTCANFRWPKQNKEFWFKKINENVERDKRTMEELEKSGYRVAVVWECALRSKQPEQISDVAQSCKKWIYSGNERLEIPVPYSNSEVDHVVCRDTSRNG